MNHNWLYDCPPYYFLPNLGLADSDTETYRRMRETWRQDYTLRIDTLSDTSGIVVIHPLGNPRSKIISTQRSNIRFRGSFGTCHYTWCLLNRDINYSYDGPIYVNPTDSISPGYGMFWSYTDIYVAIEDIRGEPYGFSSRGHPFCVDYSGPVASSAIPPPFSVVEST
ncbi:MAG: hypothetical protein ABIM30_09665 [candidate division WOR-3 bacterium]